MALTPKQQIDKISAELWGLLTKQVEDSPLLQELLGVEIKGCEDDGEICKSVTEKLSGDIR